jgi:flagellar protein FliS
VVAPAKQQVREFLAQQILTAPKEQLLLMLVDGAVNFAERARGHLDRKEFEDFGKTCIRAQRIMMELICSLRKDLVGEELYRNLVGLYHFVYTRLVEANLRRDAGLLEEALKILRPVRDMWHEAVAKDQMERRQFAAPPAAGPAPDPPADRPRGGLSLTG